MGGTTAQPDLEQGQQATTGQVVTPAATKEVTGTTITYVPNSNQARKDRHPPQPEAYKRLLNSLQPESNADMYRADEGAESHIKFQLRGIPALEIMHRLSLQQAKLALYTDYYTTKVNEIIPCEGVPTPSELNEHVSQYSRAMADYKAFSDNERIGYDIRGPDGKLPPSAFPERVRTLKIQYDPELIEIAARAAAIKGFEVQLESENRSKAEIQQLISGLKSNLEKQQQQIFARLSTDELLQITNVTNGVRGGPTILRTMKKAFLKRLYMALFGGLILIAPMLIMRLHSDLLTVVLTTSVFVIVVSIILACAMWDAEPKDILGAAAAYAAVLVVFVGQGTVTSDSSWGGGKVAGVTIGVIIGLSLIGGCLSLLWMEYQRDKAYDGMDGVLGMEALCRLAHMEHSDKDGKRFRP